MRTPHRRKRAGTDEKEGERERDTRAETEKKKKTKKTRRNRQMRKEEKKGETVREEGSILKVPREEKKVMVTRVSEIR